jgi:hypothetical protein
MSIHRPKLSMHPNSSSCSFMVLVDGNKQRQGNAVVPGPALLTKKRLPYLGTDSHRIDCSVSRRTHEPQVRFTSGPPGQADVLYMFVPPPPSGPQNRRQHRCTTHMNTQRQTGTSMCTQAQACTYTRLQVDRIHY